jgi:hypothetical protein
VFLAGHSPSAVVGTSNLATMGSIQNEDHMQKPPPFHLTEVDRQVLAQTDDEFVYHDWEELSGIIGKCQLCCYYLLLGTEIRKTPVYYYI